MKVGKSLQRYLVSFLPVKVKMEKNENPKICSHISLSLADEKYHHPLELLESECFGKLDHLIIIFNFNRKFLFFQHVTFCIIHSAVSRPENVEMAFYSVVCTKIFCTESAFSSNFNPPPSLANKGRPPNTYFYLTLVSYVTDRRHVLGAVLAINQKRTKQESSKITSFIKFRSKLLDLHIYLFLPPSNLEVDKFGISYLSKFKTSFT